MQPAIQTVGLRRVFGALVAVERLDLEVEPGTFFGFLGPNGAGKSTTIKMLTGLLAPSAGCARILGRDVVADAVAAKGSIGVVPEESALFERLTGPEYLRFVGRMYGMERPLIDARCDELLGLMGLAGEASKLIVDFSHGMRKKLSLCAAIIHEPQVLFLDEPFEGIDAVSSRLVRSILEQLVASGATIFLTSHILEIVEKLCSRVAIIHSGRLVAEGPLEDLRRGVGHGEGGRRSLEDLFLSLVGADHPERARLSWLE
ncbi:MAG TPA: ABC transporter ATP-binding protein [Candidatus Sulfomarinibacteraceae bacterium]|nr:ABC transporter ATP-binding protein [Candidatus Sulfomarinibacteraceae bacterium]